MKPLPYFLQDAISLVRDFSIFQHCEDSEIGNLLTEAYWNIRQYDVGELFFPQNLQKNALLILISGRIRHYESDVSNDRLHLIRTMNPGDEFEPTIIGFEKQKSSWQLKVDLASTILFMDTKIINGWIRTGMHPKFFAGLAASLKEQNRTLAERVSILSNYETGDRLIAYLRQRLSETPEKKVKIVDHSKLAEELCVNRTALYRTLSKLKREGRMIQDGEALFLP